MTPRTSGSHGILSGTPPDVEAPAPAEPTTEATGANRGRSWAGDAKVAGILGLVSVGLLAANEGGYFPTAWGWAALALF